ncbi:hypothetical protein [Paenibacillus sp. AR247]|uniref:hypothetical protein n=1 Tax=Paenibacillus sp. AR247 TaxID=1631599 RepID=UPI000CF88B70|nr:hypothetical protein [Paenibacillus sp. AR247]PQP85544.1 hypothetical protein CPT76_35800 [Paenibacillus sp. AR247]
MNNALWRLDPDNLAGYTEDAEVVRKIRRSHPLFILMATYSKDGKTYGWQYRIPSQKKRTARRLLGVNVER